MQSAPEKLPGPDVAGARVAFHAHPPQLSTARALFRSPGKALHARGFHQRLGPNARTGHPMTDAVTGCRRTAFPYVAPQRSKARGPSQV